MNLVPSNTQALVQRTDALLELTEQIFATHQLTRPSYTDFIETVNGVSFKMIKIPNQNYYMGETQITQELWQAVMGNNPSHFKNNPQNPVEEVSWDDIVNDFLPALNKLTGRTYKLPTEAEWEYAAMGGENYQYAGSDNIDDVGWYEGNSKENPRDNASRMTHIVKKKQPNKYGLYDMTGNVWEWCKDSFCGGSWASPKDRCLITSRTELRRSYYSYFLGFRLALV